VPLLPERPLRLKPRFALKTWLKTGLMALGCAVAGGAFVVLGVGEVRAFLDERALWEAGTPGPADVSGEVTTHEWLGFIPVGREYKLDVAYLDAAGEERTAKVEVTSLTELDTESEPEVRVDPADPSRIALSWTAQAGGGRWAWALGVPAMGLVLVVGAGLMARGAQRSVASARACARRSDERELPLLKVEQQKANGKPLPRWSITYTLPPGARGGGGKRTATVEGGEPIVLEREEGLRIVALLSPDAAVPTFPTVTLAPFDVSADEQSAFAARLAAERARGPARQSA
jgi:hypothetical protein